MADQFNLVVPIETKSGQTYWHRIGTMFKAKRGYNILLNSIPSPQKNNDNAQLSYRIMAFEQTDMDSKKEVDVKLDDEIRF